MASSLDCLKNSTTPTCNSSPPCTTSNKYLATSSRTKAYPSPPSEIKSALDAWVADRCRETRSTLREGRFYVLGQVAEMLMIPNVWDMQDNIQQRDELATILLKDVKCKQPKLLPNDRQEWNRFLLSWIRRGPITKDRLMYHLLAVDGFDGVEHKCLKNYLINVVDPDCLRQMYRLHMTAVRHMYEWFDNQPQISSLTGVDSACVVFLALLQLYRDCLCLQDEVIAMQAHQAKLWAERFLHRDSSYYQDVRKITLNLLQELGQVYKSAWRDRDWKLVAMEQLTNLPNKNFLNE
ncbi:hypothetical protein JTE90_022631 [Oedothorax gibbosus]|uniref:Uncharacterized protein n=1 Tax=Oedothorax gibbosus TaxID=931172 RepID=A0AAV6TTW0_9ARAC|nr:hypothetical protein JTE90_022631 [Oedothorax gibbosus]